MQINPENQNNGDVNGHVADEKTTVRVLFISKQKVSWVNRTDESSPLIW